MRISIDLDGVISRFNDGMVEVVNELWEGRLPLNFEPQTWGYDEVGFSTTEWDEIWTTIRRKHDFWLHLRPYEENVRALDRFVSTRDDIELFFVTSRVPTAGCTVSKQTEKWLIRNGIIPSSIYDYSTTAIIPVVSAGEKVNVMRALGITASIDDYGPTVQECAKISGHSAFLLDRPWNKDTIGVDWVLSLDQFFRIIQ